tara:strand:+ start:105 stop:419 length:315 start_codon:yes stop_codon:yes gene_type:complete
MQIFTITRPEIEYCKRWNENHGLPDNLDLVVAAVSDAGEPKFAVTGIRWVDVELCDPDDNVIDMANVPENTIYSMVDEHRERLEMSKDFERRREARKRRMGEAL